MLGFERKSVRGPGFSCKLRCLQGPGKAPHGEVLAAGKYGAVGEESLLRP